MDNVDYDHVDSLSLYGGSSHAVIGIGHTDRSIDSSVSIVRREIGNCGLSISHPRIRSKCMRSGTKLDKAYHLSFSFAGHEKVKCAILPVAFQTLINETCHKMKEARKQLGKNNNNAKTDSVSLAQNNRPSLLQNMTRKRALIRGRYRNKTNPNCPELFSDFKTDTEWVGMWKNCAGMDTIIEDTEGDTDDTRSTLLASNTEGDTDDTRSTLLASNHTNNFRRNYRWHGTVIEDSTDIDFDAIQDGHETDFMDDAPQELPESPKSCGCLSVPSSRARTRSRKYKIPWKLSFGQIREVGRGMRNKKAKMAKGGEKSKKVCVAAGIGI